MNKLKILLPILLLIFLSSFTIALIGNETNLVALYKMDNLSDSSPNGYDLTNNGCVQGSGYYYSNGASDYMTSLAPLGVDGTGDFSILLKYKSSSTARTYTLDGTSSLNRFLLNFNRDGTGADVTGNFHVYNRDSTGYSYGSTTRNPAITNNTIVDVVFTRTGTTFLTYINGELWTDVTGTFGGGDLWDAGLTLFNSYSHSDSVNEEIHELAIFSDVLTSTEVSNIYSCGELDCAFQITTNLEDYNITMVSNETITYNNTNLTQITSLFSYDTRLWNITLESNVIGYITPITYTNYNLSVNGSIITSFELLPFNITFQATQIYTGDNITNFNITLENGTIYSNTDDIFISYGFHNFTFSKDGYYNLTLLNQSIMAEGTYNFTDVYNSILNLTLKDVETNSTLTNANFSYTIDGNNYTETTTNGTFYIPIIRTNLTDTYLVAPNYAYSYNNITLDDIFENVTIYFYAENSVWVYAKDLDTSSTLTNFSVEIYNEFNIYNGTGTLIKINNITSGEYTVKVSKPDYTVAYYIITVGEGSHQDLTAYLSSTTSPITFTIIDLGSSIIIPDVTCSIYYLIGTNWTLVNSKNSDVTGRVQFNVNTANNYKFSFIKDGYTSKTFLLEPVFETYTIKLSPDVSSIPDVDKGNYYVEIMPYVVYADQINNITFNIVSGTGSLEYYNISIKSPVETVTGNYSSSYGGSYTYSINVSNVELLDTVNITYGVKEIGKDYKTYTVLLSIQGDFLHKDNTLYGFSNSLNQYGYFEKGIIATIIMLILLGIIATVSQMAGGNTFVITGVSLLVFSSIFVLIDFLPIWTSYIIGFAVIVSLLSKLREK